MRGGCKTCPVRATGCTASYMGSACAAMRAKAGVDWSPKTNAELLAELLSDPDHTRLIQWLDQPADKSLVDV